MYRNYRRRRFYNYYQGTPNNIIENKCNCVDNNLFNDEAPCECGFDEENNLLPLMPELAQSYVPYQIMNKTFVPSVGLECGTIFPELVSPYNPGQSLADIEYIKASNKIKGGCNDERV